MLVVAIALVLIISRIGYVTALVGLLAFGIIQRRRLLVILPVIAWGMYRYVPGISVRLSQVFDQRSTLYERLDLWRFGLRLFKERPLLGHGLGFYESVMGLPPHSAYVQVLVETGIIGSAVYVFLSLVPLWYGWKLMRAGNDTQMLWGNIVVVAAIVIVVGSISENVVTALAIQWPFWALVGTAFSSNHMAWNQNGKDSNLRNSGRW
jgi:O-antigen ligase